MAVWDNAPLVPVTLTLYVPAVDALTVSVDVPAIVPVTETEGGLTITVSPVEGVVVSVTVPAKPLEEATVIADVP